MPGDGDHPPGLQAGRRVHHMLHQGAPAQLVQHLGQTAFHAGALACRHDDHIYGLLRRCVSIQIRLHAGLRVDRPWQCFATIQRVQMTFKRIIGWLFAGLLLALLQGCSAIKLAYNNAPDFAYWWLDGYVDFQSEQSARVRDELARLLAWHRTEELPKIALLLQKVQKTASADVTPAQVCAVVEDTRERYHAIARQAEGPTVWLAGNLTAEQLRHVEAKFAKVNAEYQREWGRLSPQERLERRLKLNTDRAEEFYGKLGDAQLAALKSALEASQYNPLFNTAERKRRQQDLLQTLRMVSGNAPDSPKPTEAQALTLLRAYRDRIDHSPNPAYEAYSQKIMQESCASFATLHNSTTREQRERAVRRLAAYERDVRELYSQR